MFRVQFVFDKEHFVTHETAVTESEVHLKIEEAEKNGVYSFVDKYTGQLRRVNMNNVRLVNVSELPK